MGNHINVITGKWTASDFSVGNYVDSYLEYLVKGAALLGHGELQTMFDGETYHHQSVLTNKIPKTLHKILVVPKSYNA